MKPTKLFLSCEHAVDTIPEAYTHLFHDNKEILKTHRAIDFGAGEIADYLSKTLGCECPKATVSRLIIDCNRSLNNKNCFSEFTKPLTKTEKQKIIDRYYLPYRTHCEKIIDDYIHQGYQVLHLSIHSFTPTFKGVERNSAFGLLYDPKRHGEKEVAREWHGLLSQENPPYRARLNYPYSGTSNGFTTALRKKHPETDYLGIEVETNQALAKNKNTRTIAINLLTHSLKELLQLL